MCIALADAYALGVLSSCLHAPGRWLPVAGLAWQRPGHVKPPVSRNSLPRRHPRTGQARIRAPGRGTRRPYTGASRPPTRTSPSRDVQRPGKLRHEPLTAKDKAIHEQGLVAVLQQIHDELDAAVLEAYGWNDLDSANLATDTEALLERLVALERRAPPPKKPPAPSAGCAWNSRTPRRPRPRRAGCRVRPRRSPRRQTRQGPPTPASPGPPPCPSRSAPWPTPLAATPQSEADLAARFTRQGPWKNAFPKSSPCSPPWSRAQETPRGLAGLTPATAMPPLPFGSPNDGCAGISRAPRPPGDRPCAVTLTGSQSDGGWESVFGQPKKPVSATVILDGTVNVSRTRRPSSLGGNH